ncbi:histidinol-phosphate transaminase [Jannaschia aquimarina]|uniref:Histidinol-phosphate aminotransferase n=1 Tax=Jannaschia aquimarina TaxID=935700 RepID=A0A0D1EF10_9RHOB|nr:histidinol-phosphate transaminase [Jannaschia aquimarina]KIT14500.1 Histidinol-phosphate aminotransferase 2 [Jannaschia aquimarina]SNT28492.1 histidinol phosphate aminotransferase apoenzyme [Jannaschia aquimarina]
MTAAPRPQPGIMDIPLYQGGASKIAGRDDVLKLSSNENPFGAPEAAQAAAREAVGDMQLYPATDHAGLRAAIAEVHDLDPDRIICGVGSDEILHLLAQAYVGPGDEVVYPEHGFLIYPIVTRGAGGTPVPAPEHDRRVDVAAMLAAVTDRTRLVYLANPANPTGTILNGQEVTRLADGLPDGCLLVLDGAYAEYADDFDGGLALAQTRENVFATRTFSKMYGLGGMRVGWGYGPREVIDVLNRIRGPFNLSNVALAAAEAAMRDREFVTRCRDVNREQRARLAAGLRELGLAVDDSAANFVLARFAHEEAALACDAILKEHGVIVRHVASYGFPEALRITVGDADGVDRVLEGVAAWAQ